MFSRSPARRVAARITLPRRVAIALDPLCREVFIWTDIPRRNVPVLVCAVGDPTSCLPCRHKGFDTPLGMTAGVLLVEDGFLPGGIRWGQRRSTHARKGCQVLEQGRADGVLDRLGQPPMDA